MKVKEKNFLETTAICILILFAFVPGHDTIIKGFLPYVGYVKIAAEAMCIGIGIILSLKGKFKFDPFFSLLLLLQFELVFSCILNSTPVFPFIKRAVHIVAICYFIKGMGERRSLSLIKGTIMAFVILALIHLYYRIPDRAIRELHVTGSIYYLGSDNETMAALLLLFSTSVLYCSIKGLNVLSILGIFLSVFTAFYSKCGTGMIVFLVFAATCSSLLIPGLNKSLKKRVNSKTVIIVAVGYYLLLWILVSGHFTVLGNWINVLTGKDALTFSNRDAIWVEAITIIKQHPLLGIGHGNGGDGNGVYYNGLYRGAHNMILQLGVNGGVPAIIVFLAILFVTLKIIEKYSFPTRFYIYQCILVFLIAMSMENYFRGLYFIPLLSIFYYSVDSVEYDYRKTSKKLHMMQDANAFEPLSVLTN